jgi:hypothetical protein
MSGILTEPPIEVAAYNVPVPRVDRDGLALRVFAQSR